jgi:hypothetical protein
MTAREAKIAILAASGPLLLALTAVFNAYAHKLEAEAQAHEAKQQREQKYDLADSFEEYIQYVMEQRGCEP